MKMFVEAAQENILSCLSRRSFLWRLGVVGAALPSAPLLVGQADSADFGRDDGGEERTFTEDTKAPLPHVAHEADVVVAGGGMAGFGAAWAAAKAGARVLLLDNHNAPGGIYTFHGIQGMTKLFYAPDGRTQVMRGVLQEMVERYARAEGWKWDWERYSGYWAPGWTWWCYDAELLKLVLTEMLEEVGVSMLFNVWVTRAVMEGDKVKGVVYEDKEGGHVVLGRCVVDSTGDALVSLTAGVPMQPLPHPEQGFSSTFLFRVGNVDGERLVRYIEENPSEIGAYGGDVREYEKRVQRLAREWREFGMLALPDAAGSTLKRCVEHAVAEQGFRKDYLGISALDRLGIQGIRRTGIVQINTGLLGPRNLSAKELTDCQIRGRKAAYFVLDRLLRPCVPGFERAVIVSTTVELGVRTSRKITAEFNPTSKDLSVPQPDTVAVFCPDQSGLADIPYRALVPKGAEYLLVASGRSFPSAGQIAHPYREGAATLLMGQGAGVAAALVARTGIAPRSLDIGLIQKTLLSQNVYLGDASRLARLGLTDARGAE